MIVYHGTIISNLQKLLSGVSQEYPGLYVTDTYDRAKRYANAQAEGIVNPAFNSLKPGAVLVELETEESIAWRRRPDDHDTLDQCEDTITTWNVKRIIFCRYEYQNTMIQINNKYVNANEYIDSLTTRYTVTEEF